MASLLFQISSELGDGVILIKEAATHEPIGLEILSYHPGDDRFDTVSGNSHFGKLAVHPEPVEG